MFSTAMAFLFCFGALNGIAQVICMSVGGIESGCVEHIWVGRNWSIVCGGSRFNGCWTVYNSNIDLENN